MIKCIVCVSAVDWGIGKNGGLLFKIPTDMAHFKSSTTHSIVVMGENTLLSFPDSKPLKNRVNIVLCPDGHEYEGCICIHDFDQMVKFVKILAKEYDIWVIGGGMMYKSMLPYYDQVIVTKVDAVDGEAQVFFPNLDENKSFTITNESDIINTESGHKIRFVTYERLKGAK